MGCLVGQRASPECQVYFRSAMFAVPSSFLTFLLVLLERWAPGYRSESLLEQLGSSTTWRSGQGGGGSGKSFIEFRSYVDGLCSPGGLVHVGTARGPNFPPCTSFPHSGSDFGHRADVRRPDGPGVLPESGPASVPQLSALVPVCGHFVSWSAAPSHAYLPLARSMLTAVLVFTVGFRTQQGLARFWEGTGLLHQMKGARRAHAHHGGGVAPRAFGWRAGEHSPAGGRAGGGVAGHRRLCPRARAARRPRSPHRRPHLLQLGKLVCSVCSVCADDGVGVCLDGGGTAAHRESVHDGLSLWLRG